MTFTDDDLKRLKALAESDDSFRGIVSAVKTDILVLIARLEAAERVIHAVEKVRDLNAKHDWNQHVSEITETHLAWRRLKGTAT